MAFGVSDDLLATFVPIAVYWIYSGMYVMLGGLENYRLHTKAEEDTKNFASKSTVVKGILLHQVFQIAVSLILFTLVNDGTGTVPPQPSLLVVSGQFLIGMVVIDTWQYFLHRYMHINKFLYKHIHSQHHSLVVPYSFGALYSHPLEGLLVATGGVLSFLLSGMTPRTSVFFFSFATIKTVDDHCGLCLPGNLFHLLFNNNSAYHDIHHQLYGNKYNFSQAFFVAWDKSLERIWLIRSRSGRKEDLRRGQSKKTIFIYIYIYMSVAHILYCLDGREVLMNFRASKQDGVD